MLGYVRAGKAEMKIRDYEIYRGIYCSLCNALSRNYTPAARLFLSYDFAFAAILRMSIADGGCTFTQKRCPLNPAKKCLFCSELKETDFCAHAIVIITYYKLLDNLRDKETGKKILSALLYPVVALMHRRAKRLAPEIEEIVSSGMKKQAETEEKTGTGIDRAADASAEALGRIFALGYDGETSGLMYDAGYLTGRFVYIADAADDVEKDIKSGNFNPLKEKFASCSGQEFSDYIEQLMNQTQGALLDALNAIERKRFNSITKNIVLAGLDVSAGKIINKYRNNGKQTKTFTIE